MCDNGTIPLVETTLNYLINYSKEIQSDLLEAKAN